MLPTSKMLGSIDKKNLEFLMIRLILKKITKKIARKEQELKMKVIKRLQFGLFKDYQRMRRKIKREKQKK